MLFCSEIRKILQKTPDNQVAVHCPCTALPLFVTFLFIFQILTNVSPRAFVPTVSVITTPEDMNARVVLGSNPAPTCDTASVSR